MTFKPLGFFTGFAAVAVFIAALYFSEHSDVHPDAESFKVFFAGAFLGFLAFTLSSITKRDGESLLHIPALCILCVGIGMMFSPMVSRIFDCLI